MFKTFLIIQQLLIVNMRQLLLLCSMYFLCTNIQAQTSVPYENPVRIDIRTGISSSTPSDLFLFNGQVVFTANPPNAFGITCKGSSGTVLGQELIRTAYPFLPDFSAIVKDIWCGSNNSFPRDFTVFNDLLYFFADSDINPNLQRGGLWNASNIANEATVNIVKDIFPGNVSQAKYLTVSNDLLFFAAQGSTDNIELWQSDGTASGTVLSSDINSTGSSSPEGLVNVSISGSDYLFFTAEGTSNNRELWVHTSSATTSLVKEINVSGSSNPLFITDFNDQAVFFANDGAGYGLWTSDATSGGTQKVSLGAAIPLETTAPAVSNGLFYFVATDGDGAELWAYDGVTAFQVSNINPGAASANPEYLTDVNGTLYFAATRSDVGTELFSSDGTSGGTVLVSDIKTGIESSSPHFITDINGLVFFYVKNINPIHADNGYLYYHNPLTSTTDLYFDFQPADAESLVRKM